MKKAMVLQDIKNTNSPDPDPPASGRRRKERSRKAVTTGKSQDLDVSQTDSPAHNLNLPLLQRIQMALTKTKEDSVPTEEVKEEEQQSADVQLPDSPALVQNPVDESIHEDNPEESTSERKDPDDLLSSQSLNAGVEVATVSILEPTTANSSLDQAFCNISELEQSSVDSQCRVSAGTSLLCSEQPQDLDTTPKAEEAQVSSHRAQESCDKLSHIASSTLMSPDILQIAEGFKADTERFTVQAKATEQKITPNVCVLSQLEENQNIPSTSNKDNIVGGPSGTKRDSSGITISSAAVSTDEGRHVPNPNVSTPKDILDDLDLEVENFVSGRESKRRKSSRRRSQQVFSLPVMTAEPSPEVIEKEEETRATQDTTPSLCIVNDKKRGARGRRKRTPAVTASTASPVEDCTPVSPEDSPVSDQRSGNVTPDTDVSDHSSHSDDRKSPVTTPAPNVESFSTSPEDTDHRQIGAAVSDIITPSVCLIDDHNSRRRRKKSPVTATSPGDDCIAVPSEDVRQQPEGNVTADTDVSDHSSHSDDRKSPATTTATNVESSPTSPEDTDHGPIDAAVSDIITPPVCLIDDRNSRRRRKKSPVTATLPPDDCIALPAENVGQQPEGNVTADTDVSDHSSHSDDRKSPATTTATNVETSPTSPEDTDHGPIDAAVSDIITLSVCLIDDRNSRRRRKKSPVTATLPQDDCTAAPSEDVRQQPEVQTESGPTVCISSGRGSRGRRRKAPADTRTSTDMSASGSPEDTVQCEQKTDDASSVCVINDAPRGSHKKRRKRAGEDTPSPEVPVQSSTSEVCTPVSECTSKTTHPAETVTQDLPQLDVLTPWVIPETTPLRGEPQFSFTAVKEVEDGADNCDLKRKVSKKRRRQADLEKPIVAEAASSVLPPENIQQTELPVPEGDQQTNLNLDQAQASQDPSDELMLDDVDFGESFPTIEKPKRQQKRRRKSADFDISNASVVVSPNLEENIEGLNWLENQAPSRRSKRLRRKSLDLYRDSISKAREEDEERRRQSTQQEINMAEENQEVSEDEKSQEVIPEDGQEKTKDDQEKVDMGSGSTVPVISPECNSDSQTDDSVTEDEPRRPRRAPKVNLTVQLEEASASSCPKPKAKRGKKTKKNEPSVEDIYLNKLWRTQMPKDKIWETIFEAPKSTKWGTEEYMSKMRLKRHVNFDDFYATNRLKRRRQKALKMGWKPLSEQKDMVAAANLEERIQVLDREISIIETKTVCEPEVDRNVVPTVCVRLASPSTEQTPAEGEDDFYTPVQSASNLLQFGQLEDVDTDLSASLNSADVTTSPLQTFTTPMLESVGDKLKSFASCESPASKTQSDSKL